MAEIISIAIGLIVPIIVELLKKVTNPKQSWIKYVVSFVVCIIAGTATKILVDGTNFKDIESLLENIGIVFVSAQSFYNLYFKGSNIQERIAGEEKK